MRPSTIYKMYKYIYIYIYIKHTKTQIVVPIQNLEMFIELFIKEEMFFVKMKTCVGLILVEIKG